MSTARYVTGLRAVEQLLSQRAAEVLKIYAEYQTSNPRLLAVIDQANTQGIEIQSANRARLQQMGGESRHQGVVAEIRRSQVLDDGSLRTLVEECLAKDESLLILVLDGVQDPHNLGACIRSADAAGVSVVVVPKHGAAGLGPTVSKVAAGAAEVVPFAAVSNIGKTLAWMVEYGITIVGTSDTGEKSLYDCSLSGSVALVMGREHSGLRKNVAARCDELISLPMHGSVSSLNVSVATGICLYEIVRQRKDG
jgi:23S rRNA (guanosine2251-2'-O)-methyltransferase|tara:strand:- start:804 stop:1559 length:756 start_codon:yes stop_codon:yes gene_type:complete